MRVVITGASGGLGGQVVAEGQRLHSNWEVIGLNRESLDLADFAAVEEKIISLSPEIIVHCAAMTAVDRCEQEGDLAWLINVEGTRAIKEAADRSGALLVFISTDYIFDGCKKAPYNEEDEPKPLSVYGKTKLEGERIVASGSKYIIVRTGWLYGRMGKSFASTILRLALNMKELRIVNDQTGSPTYSYDLSHGILKLMEEEATGTFNITNAGYCTWYDFAREILKIKGISGVDLVPISSEELDRPARRPLNSRLDCSKYAKISGSNLRPWREALAEALLCMEG